MVSANIAYEEQEIRSSEDVKGGFVVRSITQNPDVIYGKSFKTENLRTEVLNFREFSSIPGTFFTYDKYNR